MAFQKRRSKYGTSEPKHRTVDGITFDSKAEMKRYIALKHDEKTGKITDLRLQHPKLKWGVKYYTDGKVAIGRAMSYTADFSYYDASGKYVVEDVKGMKTPEYKRKKKIVKDLFNIDIVEIPAKSC